MSFFSRKNQNSQAGTSSQPIAAPAPSAPSAPSETSAPIAAPVPEPIEMPPSPTESTEAIPLPEVPEAAAADTSGTDTSDSGLSPEFYGSYSAAVETASSAASPAAEVAEETNDTTVSGIDFSVLDFDLPSGTDTQAVSESAAVEENDTFRPSLDVSEEEDDELVLPDLPPVAVSAPGETKKSMGYETTVQLKNARSAYGNEKPVNEPIKSGAPRVTLPKRDYTVVASGTAHVSGDLPKLKDGEMYVAVTPKELRRLKSRRFRGLGVFATLCLGIIAAFCIWSYANSFTDPLIGVWKGDMNAAYLPVSQIQELDQEIIASTWEFSNSGSLYLNVVVNETPISLSGSYEQKKDESGEPYIAMTLTNPMDSTDYTLEMYYTVTGDVLEFNDMEGMGMTIDLTKE